MNPIWIQPDGGLGNRLNCIYSGLYYSRKYDEKLHIVWLREKGCNIDFEELFEVPENVKIHTFYNMGLKSRYAIKSLISKLTYKRLLKKMEYMDAGKTRYLYFESGEEGIIQKLCKEQQVLLVSSGPFCDKENFASVREGLVARKDIKDMANRIMSSYQDKKVCGIHIRRSDHQMAIDNSPLEKFTEYMDKKPEGTFFYLATDDEEIRQTLEKKYNIIPRITYSDTVTRTSSQGMKDALVEMICLSKCDSIFGSFGSTFSMIAAFMGKCRLEFAGQKAHWNEELKLNEDLIKSWHRDTDKEN